MSADYHYGRDGLPISQDEWGSAYAQPRHVGRTKVTDAADPSNSFDVSTVWLGINHRFGSGPPLIFETVVFAEGSSMDERCERYSTEQQAREGHTATVAEVAATLTDPIVMDAEETS